MSALRNCRSVGVNGWLLPAPGVCSFLARFTTPTIRSPTRSGTQMKDPPPYLGSLILANRGSFSTSSTSTASPSSTTLPAMPSPTFTSTCAPAWSISMPRPTATRSTCRSRSKSMIDPMLALTARMVRSSTWASKSSTFGILAAISTMSLSVPSLKTRSCSRSVEARSSVSMPLKACAISPISVIRPSPGTTDDDCPEDVAAICSTGWPSTTRLRSEMFEEMRSTIWRKMTNPRSAMSTASKTPTWAVVSWRRSKCHMKNRNRSSGRTETSAKIVWAARRRPTPR